MVLAARSWSIKCMRSESVLRRSCAICLRADQNASSKLTLVLRPAITTERFLIFDDFGAWGSSFSHADDSASISLTPMSNFAFLAAEFPAVHEAAAEAERQAGVSPTAAAFFAGKAVEVAVKWAFRADPNLKLPYEDNISVEQTDETRRRPDRGQPEFHMGCSADRRQRIARPLALGEKEAAASG